MLKQTKTNPTKISQQIHYWILAARPKTLTISVSAVFLGTILASSQFDLLSFILCLLIAINLQIAVNFANDYSDGKTGIDTNERIGPIRVVAAGLIPAKKVKCAYKTLLIITACLALALAHHVSYFLLLILVISVLATLAYSAGPFPIASNALGELFAFLFFGPIAVTCTYYTHTQQINPSIIFYSCVIGCYSAATMLVNNIRDIKSDQQAGKQTLAALLGVKNSQILYILLLTASLGFHLLATKHLDVIPKYIPVIICIIPIVFLSRAIFNHSGQALNTVLGKTAALSILYTLSILIGLVISH